jgi:hypothetical protein
MFIAWSIQKQEGTYFDNRAFELPIFPGDGLRNDGATRFGLEGAGYRPF